MIAPELLADELRARFNRSASGMALRLREVTADGDVVRVIIDGHGDDSGGPYGAIITIPRDEQDPLWSDWPDFSIEEWIEHAAFGLVVEAYETRALDARRDGVTWLRLDE